MRILEFANELLLMVAENLAIGDLSRFRSTSQRLHILLTPHYKKLCLKDTGKLTVLQWAAVRGHVELIELAISNGPGIDKPLGSTLDKSAPHISDRPSSVCQFANLECVDHGKNAIPRTPLYLAACSRKAVAIQALLKAGATMQCLEGMSTPAHVAATTGDVNCMQAFISGRFDIHTIGCRDHTILHQATYGGVKMVRYVLEHAEGERLINVKNVGNRTPLHLVAGGYSDRYNRREITELLVQHGADIHMMDWKGNSPAHLAALSGDVDTMRVLIAAGIDFHARGAHGKTIFHRATCNRKGVLEYLSGKWE